MPAVEVVAVNQCSGNRRGLFQPHVAGVEWGYGAMGCARWKGARLKDVLDKVGLKKEAIEIVFDGADGPSIDKTPDFVKSIPVWKAIEDNTLIAYEMNGAAAAALQRLSGAHHRAGLDRHLLDEARHLDQGGDQAGVGFWMNPAYRIPLGQVPAGGALHLAGDRRQHADHRNGGELADHQPSPTARSVKAGDVTVGGIAWDGGYGIRASKSRPTAARPGRRRRSARTSAASRSAPGASPAGTKGKQHGDGHGARQQCIGQTQTTALIHNPAGYHHNVIHSVSLERGLRRTTMRTLCHRRSLAA